MYAPWYITNASGDPFKATADLYGRLTFIPAPGVTTGIPFIFLNDVETGDLYRLNLLDNGKLEPSPSNATVFGNKSFPTTDPNGGTWLNQMVNGRLITVGLTPDPIPSYPPSSCPAPWYLGDQNGVTRKLVLDSLGRLSAIPSPNSTPVLPFALLTDVVTGNIWKIVISGTGAIIATVVNVDVQGSRWIAVEGPTGDVALMEIYDSGLQTVPVIPRTDIQDPVEGVIYDPPEYLAKYTQPGGPNTQTFPLQPTGEMIALWAFGCSHFSNHIYVTSGTVNCQRAALLQCPQCSFLQRIIIPYEAIEDSNNEAYEYLFP